MIWGAGAKGVMFLNPLQVAGGSGLDRVVDINPRKQGHFVPLSGQRIIGPERLLQDPPDLVIVMNPEYECEARSMIDDLGIVCDVVSAIRVRLAGCYRRSSTTPVREGLSGIKCKVVLRNSSAPVTTCF